MDAVRLEQEATLMSASDQPAVKTPSRRALLAGAVGGLGALAAGAIGRASPVRAAPGDAVTVDGNFTGAGTTRITTTGTSGIRGDSSSTSADAVSGVATAATGPAWGVRGQSSSVSGRGVVGEAGASTGSTIGVLGQSGSTTGTGVQGHAYALSGATIGVRGQADSPAGVGVHASGAGFALQTAGRLKLSTSGIATIGVGVTSRVVTPGVAIGSSSFVLLTPRVSIGTRSLWFTIDTVNDRFTIHMSSSKTTKTPVAWLLVG